MPIGLREGGHPSRSGLILGCAKVISQESSEVSLMPHLDGLRTFLQARVPTLRLVWTCRGRSRGLSLRLNLRVVVTLRDDEKSSMSADPRTALIVIDMQNLFVDLIGDAGPRVLATVNEQVAAAVEQGWPVYYTRYYAPIELPQDDPKGETALHRHLDVRGIVVDKGPGKHGGFSGFVLSTEQQPQRASETGGLSALADPLRGVDVQAVFVVGIAADVCVAATARDAVRLGYATTVPLYATAFLHADQEGATGELRAAGVSVTKNSRINGVIMEAVQGASSTTDPRRRTPARSDRQAGRPARRGVQAALSPSRPEPACSSARQAASTKHSRT